MAYDIRETRDLIAADLSERTRVQDGSSRRWTASVRNYAEAGTWFIIHVNQHAVEGSVLRYDIETEIYMKSPRMKQSRRLPDNQRMYLRRAAIDAYADRYGYEFVLSMAGPNYWRKKRTAQNETVAKYVAESVERVEAAQSETLAADRALDETPKTLDPALSLIAGPTAREEFKLWYRACRETSRLFALREVGRHDGFGLRYCLGMSLPENNGITRTNVHRPRASYAALQLEAQNASGKEYRRGMVRALREMRAMFAVVEPLQDLAGKWPWKLPRRYGGKLQDYQAQLVNSLAESNEPAKIYRYRATECPSRHWNDGTDTCADCGYDLQSELDERDYEIANEGVKAQQAGVRWYENPYPAGSVDAASWDKGHARERGKSRALAGQDYESHTFERGDLHFVKHGFGKPLPDLPPIPEPTPVELIEPRKVWLVQAEHYHVPGLLSSVHSTAEKAQERAVELLQGIYNDHVETHGNDWDDSDPYDDSNLTWGADFDRALARLQDYHGAAHCYVEITELELDQ